MKTIAKKSLGQNFLIDKNILEKIVNLTNIKDQSIIEIGRNWKFNKIHFDKQTKKINCY